MRALARGLLELAAMLSVGCAGPISPEAENWIRIGAEALRRGDNAAAVENAGRCIQYYPRAEQSGEAYYVRGLARYRTGQIEPARADLYEALSLTRRKDLSGLAHMQLGNLAYKAGDMAAAERHFRSVLSDIPAGTPPADEAAFLLGCILQRQGKWAQADIQFDRVMHLFDGTDLAAQATARAHAVRWSLQAGAFEKPAPASELESRLRRAGLSARIDLALRAGKMLRLVLVGSLATYDAAQIELPRVQAVSPEAYAVPAR